MRLRRNSNCFLIVLSFLSVFLLGDALSFSLAPTPADNADRVLASSPESPSQFPLLYCDASEASDCSDSILDDGPIDMALSSFEWSPSVQLSWPARAPSVISPTADLGLIHKPPELS